MLLDSEIARIKHELGFPLLDVGAEPYIAHVALFEQVIKPYLSGGAATTSSTSVSASAAPSPVALTLASVAGVSAGAALIVDVDARQERATVASISGSNVIVQLAKAHSGTYPVVVEGGESIIRSILMRLATIGESTIVDAVETAGLKRVDEIEFHPDGARITSVTKLRDYWRDELASALGIERLNRNVGDSIAVY